ncbi:MAG TPA: DUF2254 family protein, partial [Paracoccaceae bacterium]|nr:DUF2254 family protein [Paracoccaceae bacterium]
MFAALLSDFHHYSRRLHVRILLITALSPLAVVLAKLFGGFLPDWLVARIGAQAVDPILTIIAGAMLAVTTFALTMMTGAFRTASSQWTPRAHLVMMEDTVTQNVLA